MRHLAVLLSLIAMIVVAGCASEAGSRANANKVDSIKVGTTTEADLIKMFGRPTGQGLDSQGRRMITWDYLYVKSNGKAGIPIAGVFMASGDVTQQLLKVSLDEKGIVAGTNMQETQRETGIFDTKK